MSIENQGQGNSVEKYKESGLWLPNTKATLKEGVPEDFALKVQATWNECQTKLDELTAVYQEAEKEHVKQNSPETEQRMADALKAKESYEDRDYLYAFSRYLDLWDNAF